MLRELPMAAREGSGLCVVGNLNRDVKTAPFASGAHLFRDGETSVPWIVETTGGGGANSAAAAAALGARAGFLGKVGNDHAARRLEDALRAAGVETRLARDPSLPTGTSINLTYEDGHRHFVSALPTSAALRFEDLDLDFVRSFAHLHRADVWFSEPLFEDGNERLLESARNSGLAVSLDINWDPRWGRAEREEVERRKESVRRLLPLVDLVHGNARELCEFSDSPDLTEALRRLERWGAGAIVVHLGAEGSGYHEKGRLVTAPAVPAARRVETTGTGDVLSVCMMLLHSVAGMDPRERLALSNAIVTEFIEGRRPLIPRLA